MDGGVFTRLAFHQHFFASQTLTGTLVLLGAYPLEVEEARTGLLAPLRVLPGRPGTLLAIVASALRGATTVLEKLAIEYVTPLSGPLVALLGTFLLVVLLIPGYSVSHSQRSPLPPGNPGRGCVPMYTRFPPP